MKKLFKSGRDLENALLAAVIRDLKIVKVMDLFLITHYFVFVWKI